jgi:phosphonopyruvate decarboxylase
LIAAWRASDRWYHIPAVNEAEAIGVAAGASVRQRSFVYLQNSGIGYALDGLTSLVMPADLPVTVLISHRGLTSSDALPQHTVAGQLTMPVIKALDVPYATCYASSRAAFNRAVDTLPVDRLSVLVLAPDLKWQGRVYPSAQSHALPPRNSVASSPTPSASGRFEQGDVLATILKRVSNQVVVTSTGYLSRQVFALRDRVRNVYLTGSMGLTASFALGVDSAYEGMPGVVVIDGDGSALMHLGSLATVATFGGSRYKHVVIDNNAYASTGGQPSSSGSVSFSQLAIAAGYRAAANAAEFGSIDRAVEWLFGVTGPALLEVDVALATSDVPRVNINPSDRVRRLRRSLQRKRRIAGGVE